MELVDIDLNSDGQKSERDSKSTVSPHDNASFFSRMYLIWV